MHKVEMVPAKAIISDSSAVSPNKVTQTALPMLRKSEEAPELNNYKFSWIKGISKAWNFFISFFTRCFSVFRKAVPVDPKQDSPAFDSHAIPFKRRMIPDEVTRLKSEIGWDYLWIAAQILRKPQHINRTIIVEGDGKALYLELINDALHAHYYKKNVLYSINDDTSTVQEMSSEQLVIFHTQFSARKADLSMEPIRYFKDNYPRSEYYPHRKV